MSWPSAKMSAATTTSSPTVRLIGNRPPSISGRTPSMITRDGAGPDFVRDSAAMSVIPRPSRNSMVVAW